MITLTAMMRRLLLLIVIASFSISSAMAAAEHPPLTTLDGKSLTLSSFEGKAVLINFWATWCGPCRKEMPELDHVSQRLDPDKAVVLGVAADEAQGVASYLDKLGISYANVVGDPDQMFSWSAQIGNYVQGVPYSALLDSNGEIIWTKTGELDFTELETVLAEYFAAE